MIDHKDKQIKFRVFQNLSIIILFLLIFNLISFTHFFLPNLNAQSLFSFVNEGESILRGDAHMASLGYCEIPGTFSSNLVGSIAFLKKTGIDVTYSGIRLEMMDGNGKNVIHYYSVPSVKVASTLPLGLAMSFNLRREMDQNANFITTPDSVEGLSYNCTFFKKGQISTGNFEIAKKINKWAGIGCGVNVLFGGSDEVWITDFTDPLVTDTEDSLSSHYFGYSYSLGLVINLEPVDIVFGYSFPVSCEKVTKSLYNIGQDTILSENNLIFPSFYSCGCDISLGQDLDFLFTIRYRDWSNFKYNETKNDDFLDVLSYSIGLEYGRTGDDNVRRFPLRIGYFLNPWYFKDSHNKRIVDNGITIGSSIPIMRKDGFLDVAFIAGRRKMGGLEERFYKFLVGFNFYERW